MIRLCIVPDSQQPSSMTSIFHTISPKGIPLLELLLYYLNFHIESIPQSYRVLKGAENIKPISNWHCILIPSHSVSQDATQYDNIWRFFLTWHEALLLWQQAYDHLQRALYSENPAVLKNPPVSTYRDVVNLISYPSSIAIASPVA